MTDISDGQQTRNTNKKFERRSGKDRRKVHTMTDPGKDRRTWDRRKINETEKP